MRTYLYTVGHSPQRNMDVQVKAYRLKHNDPIYLGCSDHQTRSWRGGSSEACRIIASNSNEKLHPDGYGLLSSEARVISL